MHTTIVAGKLDEETNQTPPNQKPTPNLTKKPENMADFELSEAQKQLVTENSPDIIDLAKCFINVNSISGTETPMADLMELWFNSRDIEYVVEKQEVEPEKFSNKGVQGGYEMSRKWPILAYNL